MLLIIFGGIALHAPLSVGFGTLWPQYSLAFKSWKELLLLGLVPIVIIIISRRGLWRELLHDWLFRLIGIYGILHGLLAIIFFNTIATTLAGLAIDLRFIVFFALVYIGIKIMPGYRRRMLQVGGAGAVVVVGFATLQLFLPADALSYIGYNQNTIMPYLTVDKNPQYIRVNSTLRGPNPLGAYAAIVLTLLTAWWFAAKKGVTSQKRLIFSGLLGLGALIALWISYSRSAWAGAIAGVGIALAASVKKRIPRRVWIGSMIAVGAVGGAAVLGSGSVFISNVILHENPIGGSSVSSNEGHLQSLESSFAQALHQPFGAGIGSTGSASLYGGIPQVIENQYLFVAHETGWLGLGLFMGLFVLILVRLWRRRADWLSVGMFASGVGLAIIGLLLPVWADDTVSIIWWGLAALALAGGNNAKPSQ